MQHTLDAEIRQQLYRFLMGDTDLLTFENWFVAASWDHLGAPASALTSLIGSVELALAEYTSGHAEIAALRDDLWQALDTILIGEPVVRGESSGTIIQQTLTARVVAGKSAGMTSASVAVSSR